MRPSNSPPLNSPSSDRVRGYSSPVRVARMGTSPRNDIAPRPPPSMSGGSGSEYAGPRRHDPSMSNSTSSSGSILPVLTSPGQVQVPPLRTPSPNAFKRTVWTTPRSPHESREASSSIPGLQTHTRRINPRTFDDDQQFGLGEDGYPYYSDDSVEESYLFHAEPIADASPSSFQLKPRRGESEKPAYTDDTQLEQLAHMEQMYNTIQMLNAELAEERQARARPMAPSNAVAAALEHPLVGGLQQLTVSEFHDPSTRLIVAPTPSAASGSPASRPLSQPKRPVPPQNSKTLPKDQAELCATLGKNAELRIRAKEMEKNAEKSSVQLDQAQKQMKMVERRISNREEKLRILLKEKLHWQKEVKDMRDQVVEEKRRQVELLRRLETGKRENAAQIEQMDRDLRDVHDENQALRAQVAEAKAHITLQARKMDEVVRQARDDKEKLVSCIAESRYKFKEWKEGEAAALRSSRDQAMNNMKTEYDLKIARHQEEKQKLREKVKDLEVSLRLMQKDRTLSPLELSLRKATILGSKENAGTAEAELIEAHSRIRELAALLEHSQEYQKRQDAIIKVSEATISRLVQEREVTALENLSMQPLAGGFMNSPFASDANAFSSSISNRPVSSSPHAGSQLETPKEQRQDALKSSNHDASYGKPRGSSSRIQPPSSSSPSSTFTVMAHPPSKLSKSPADDIAHQSQPSSGNEIAPERQDLCVHDDVKCRLEMALPVPIGEEVADADAEQSREEANRSIQAPQEPTAPPTVSSKEQFLANEVERLQKELAEMKASGSGSTGTGNLTSEATDDVETTDADTRIAPNDTEERDAVEDEGSPESMSRAIPAVAEEEEAKTSVQSDGESVSEVIESSGVVDAGGISTDVEDDGVEQTSTIFYNNGEKCECEWSTENLSDPATEASVAGLVASRFVARAIHTGVHQAVIIESAYRKYVTKTFVSSIERAAIRSIVAQHTLKHTPDIVNEPKELSPPELLSGLSAQDLEGSAPSQAVGDSDLPSQVDTSEASEDLHSVQMKDAENPAQGSAAAGVDVEAILTMDDDHVAPAHAEVAGERDVTALPTSLVGQIHEDQVVVAETHPVVSQCADRDDHGSTADRGVSASDGALASPKAVAEAFVLAVQNEAISLVVASQEQEQQCFANEEAQEAAVNGEWRTNSCDRAAGSAFLSSDAEENVKSETEDEEVSHQNDEEQSQAVLRQTHDAPEMLTKSSADHPDKSANPGFSAVAFVATIETEAIAAITRSIERCSESGFGTAVDDPSSGEPFSPCVFDRGCAEFQGDVDVIGISGEGDGGYGELETNPGELAMESTQVFSGDAETPEPEVSNADPDAAGGGEACLVDDVVQVSAKLSLEVTASALEAYSTACMCESTADERDAAADGNLALNPSSLGLQNSPTEEAYPDASAAQHAFEKVTGRLSMVQSSLSKLTEEFAAKNSPLLLSGGSDVECADLPSSAADHGDAHGVPSDPMSLPLDGNAGVQSAEVAPSDSTPAAESATTNRPAVPVAKSGEAKSSGKVTWALPDSESDKTPPPPKQPTKAEKRRLSRRLQDQSRFASMEMRDPTLAAYDAHHEQDQPFALLDDSILSIDPNAKHMQHDESDQAKYTESEIRAKRKNVDHDNHRKSIAYRSIPAFNYAPVLVRFQWSDFVVAMPISLCASNPADKKAWNPASPVKKMRLLVKKGIKLPCGSYVIISAFIRPLEDGNENLRIHIYDSEWVEEFQYDFFEDHLKEYMADWTGQDDDAKRFMTQLEFRREEGGIIIKLPEKIGHDRRTTSAPSISEGQTLSMSHSDGKEHPHHDHSSPPHRSSRHNQRPPTSPHAPFLPSQARSLPNLSDRCEDEKQHTKEPDAGE